MDDREFMVFCRGICTGVAAVAAGVAIGAMLFLPSKACAQERYTTGLHLATWHDSGSYNDRNPGVYLRTPAGWTAGTYHNSHRRQSVHVGRTWRHATGWGDLSITMGAVTGYARPLQPLVVPSLRIWHVRLTALPRADPKGAAGVHLSVEF